MSSALGLKSAIFVAAGLSFLSLVSSACDNGGATEPDQIVKLLIEPDSAQIEFADTLRLNAYFVLQSGDTVPAEGVVWIPVEPAIVDVDSTGLATAVSTGTATVVATAGGLAAEATLVVVDPIIGLRVAPDTASITVGDSVRFVARLVLKSDNEVPAFVTWSSLAPAVANVDATGLATALSPGTATIVAEAEVFSAQATLSVVAPEILRLEVSPDTAYLEVGDTLRFTAWFLLESGDTVPAYGVSWSSLAPAVADVGTTGLATGVSLGTATIVAEAEGFSVEATLYVCEQIVGLRVSPDTANLEVGDTLRFSAWYLVESGDTVPACDVSWSSLLPTVAGVDSTGLATARSVGWGRILAEAKEFAAHAEVIVTGPGGWFGVPPLPEARRAGHAAALEGKVYYIGGTATLGEDYVSTMFIFDPESETWSIGPYMPTARDQGGTAVAAGRIYVIGGVNPSAPNNGYSRLWANEGFSAADGLWEVRAPMPTARGHARADTLNGKIYVIAGSTVVENYDTVEVYDPVSNSWSVAPSIPTLRWNFAAGSIGGRLYAVGGEVARLVPTGSLEIFDPTAGSWISGPAMPTPRLFMASAVLEDCFVVLGGRDGTTAYLDVVEAYDPGTGSWSTLPPLPVARREARAAVVAGVMYVIGGVTSEGITDRVDGFVP